MDAFLICSVVASDVSKAMDPLIRKKIPKQNSPTKRMEMSFHFVSILCPPYFISFRVWTMSSLLI